MSNRSDHQTSVCGLTRSSAGWSLGGGAESSYDGGEHNVGLLGGVDGRVQPPGLVVLDQRERLPVVGVQTGPQRRLVVVAAADQRLTRHLQRGGD